MKSISLFNDSEIIASNLLIIQKLLGIPGKADYWQILMTERYLEKINTFLADFLINNEIVTYCLKIVLAYALAAVFTKQVSEFVNLETLSSVFEVYFMEKFKIRAISQILSETLVYTEESKLEDSLKILFKVLKRNFNWSEVVHFIFKSFCRLLKTKTCTLFLNQKSVDLYVELVVHLGGEMHQYEDILDFIHLLGLQHEEIKTQV